jgi:serine protease Do
VNNSVPGPAIPGSDDRLQLYDVIEEVARQPVRSQEELRERIAEQPAGKPLLLKVRRRVNGREESRLILWQHDVGPQPAGPSSAPRPSC